MFARVKKSGKYQYLQIVENRKEKGKVKQRVIATLGRLAGGGQAMAAEKQNDQNPEGRESVTRFFFEFVS